MGSIASVHPRIGGAGDSQQSLEGDARSLPGWGDPWEFLMTRRRVCVPAAGAVTAAVVVRALCAAPCKWRVCLSAYSRLPFPEGAPLVSRLGYHAARTASVARTRTGMVQPPHSQKGLHPGVPRTNSLPSIAQLLPIRPPSEKMLLGRAWASDSVRVQRQSEPPCKPGHVPAPSPSQSNCYRTMYPMYRNGYHTSSDWTRMKSVIGMQLEV